ncbi:hypothetical protein NL676_025346 [Syzygium grande]|nr:hypothetical protein NL676_025346 [Syzygium grande]
MTALSKDLKWPPTSSLSSFNSLFPFCREENDQKSLQLLRQLQILAGTVLPQARPSSPSSPQRLALAKARSGTHRRPRVSLLALEGTVAQLEANASIGLLSWSSPPTASPPWKDNQCLLQNPGLHCRKVQSRRRTNSSMGSGLLLFEIMELPSRPFLERIAKELCRRLSLAVDLSQGYEQHLHCTSHLRAFCTIDCCEKQVAMDKLREKRSAESKKVGGGHTAE